MELVEKCNEVFLIMVNLNKVLEMFDKYLDFCEKYRPAGVDLIVVLENFHNEIDAWIRGVGFYTKHDKISDGYLLINRANQ